MRALLAWSVVAATVVTALTLTRAPKPVDASAPGAAFSSERAFKHVERIAVRPHPTHSVANAEVRLYVEAAFRDLGLAVTTNVRVSDGDGRPLQNVIAKKPGHASTGVVMVACHYDAGAPGGTLDGNRTWGPSPGASDDGAAVAAAIESARALITSEPLRNDVWFLITDAEEAGMLGAFEFVRQNPDAKRVDIVLNFEARGTSGRSLMFQTSPRNGALVEAYAEVALRPSACSLMDDVYRKLMPNNSDFTAFLQGDMKGMNFAFIGDYRHYHTAHDSPENLSHRSLQHHGTSMLGLVRHFGNHDLRAFEHRDDVVYFDVLARGFVIYPVSWTWPLTIFALVVLGLALAVGVRRGDVTWVQLGWGGYAAFRAMAYAAIVIGALAFVALEASGDRMTGPVPGSSGDTWFYVGLSLLVLGVVNAATGSATARSGFAAVGIAPLLVIALLLVLVTASLTGATFILLWPLILILAAWCASVRIRRDSVAALVAFVYVIPVVLLVAPLQALLFQGLALPRAILHAPLLGLMFASIAPLLDRAGGGWRRPIVIAPVVIGLVVYAVGFFA